MTELNERYPPCIHISAGSAVLEDFDRINDITPQEGKTVNNVWSVNAK